MQGMREFLESHTLGPRSHNCPGFHFEPWKDKLLPEVQAGACGECEAPAVRGCVQCKHFLCSEHWKSCPGKTGYHCESMLKGEAKSVCELAGKVVVEKHVGPANVPEGVAFFMQGE